MTANSEFKVGDFVVYPAHGVGKLTEIETHEISSQTIQLLVINFDKERMTLRLPINKARSAGLRHLSTNEEMTTALDMLTIKTRHKKTMWSRRAQEYEAKINSGDPKSIAEVLRELYRANGEVEQSYSERQIYQAAFERLSRELAAVEAIEEDEAMKKVSFILTKVA